MSSICKITKNLEKKYWVYTILSPVTMIGEVFLETVIPFLMALIIDNGISQRDVSYVLRTGAVMACCAVVSLACGAGGARFGAAASQGFSRNLRRRLFSKIQSFSFYNIDRFSTASLVTRLTTDVTNVQNVYQLIVRICFRAPFMLVAGTVMAFILNGRLALVFCIAVPFLSFVIAFISIKAYSRFALMLEKYDRLNTAVQENLIGIRVVKAFVRGEKECGKFEAAADSVRRTQVDAERLVIKIGPAMQAVIYATVIAVYWFGGRMVVFGGMKAGELVSFITYIGQILMALMMMGMVLVNIVLSRASVKRICEVLDEVPDISSCSEPLNEVRDGSIDFEAVDFSYSKNIDNCILKNINIHIESGSTVGIIGGTGAGKSSLVALIPRLYDVTAGCIKLGGADVRSYALDVLRDKVAVVLQKNVLFSGTIKENLRWGNKSSDDEELRAACRAADADDFIMAFPEGYDTELGQGGVNLSGGQKQRICIARALLKKPAVLILDDSTSAVDTATEKRIRNSLKEQCSGTTKIIISQRISSVKDAGVIFVLDGGKISGYGTHEQLLESNAIYREVYDSQRIMGDADE